jgi:peptidoglycan hydrolase-like protein with peptidoglycan-binding domain
MAYTLSQFKVILNGLGYNLGPTGISGNYGNILDCYTQAAIQEFQAHYRLPTTGEVDRTTQEKARQLVRNLQHSLNLAIDAQLPLNEFYGPRTTRAVQLFQYQQGLPMTGIAGLTVRRKIETAAKQQLRCHVMPMTLPPDAIVPDALQFA